MGSEVVVIDADIKARLNQHRFKIMADLEREVTLKDLLSSIVKVYLANEEFQKQVIRELQD